MSKCQIICEVGASHHGDIKQAIKLIKAAKTVGADFVKFQIWLDLDKFVSKSSEYYEPFKEWGLSRQDWIKLYDYSQKSGIQFIASAFDNEAIDLLCDMGVPFLKIASGDITYLPFIEYIANKGLPVMFSTGMASWEEIMKAAGIMSRKGIQSIPMICTARYPCEPENVNLRRAQTLIATFPIWGFSDHTKGILASTVAASLEAHYIEKHMDIEESDDACGIETFKTMIEQIKETEKILGEVRRFYPLECENEVRLTARRNEGTWLRE